MQATRPMSHSNQTGEYIQVQCYSGYKYGERPKTFEWSGKWYEISRVTDQWLTPAGAAFRVTTVDEYFFELHYNEATHSWLIKQI